MLKAFTVVGGALGSAALLAGSIKIAFLLIFLRENAPFISNVVGSALMALGAFGLLGVFLYHYCRPGSTGRAADL